MLSHPVDSSNAPGAASPAWRLAPGQTLRHRAWQGEYVLYNDISGDTHLLDADAAALLLALQHGPARQSDLLGDADAAGGAELLDQLRELALIEAVA